MLSLNKKTLLFPSLSRRRLEWDNEKIMSQKLPDDVAAFFTQSIADLPSNVRISLFHISCFGASVEQGNNYGGKMAVPARNDLHGMIYPSKKVTFRLAK